MVHHSEVSKAKRLAQVGCAIFWCLLSAGPVFGFAALKPVLINENIYRSYCTKQELEDAVPVCTQQDLKLNNMFTGAAVVTNLSALVIGYVLDSFGPRICGYIGSFFLALGSFIFIYARSITWFDPYLTGYCALALGGPFSYISSFQLSNSFPEYSGTILALITGAFDASSAVFLVYKMIYEKTAHAFDLKQFFQIYLVMPLFIATVQTFLMPSTSYKTINDLAKISEEGTDDPNEETTLLDNGNTRRRSYVKKADEPPEIVQPGVFGILHGKTVGQQMISPFFFLMALFATISMLRLNYFVATVRSQYKYLLGSEAGAQTINAFFDIALPMGGLVSIPFVGLLLDNVLTVTSLTVLYAVSLTIGVSGLIPNITAGYFNVILFVAYRPLFYTTLSDYCAKIFGFDTFGTVYGTIICTAGVVNLAQAWLDQLTHTVFAMNPTPINIVLVALTFVLGGLLIAYVKFQGDRFYRWKVEVRKSISHFPGY